MKETIRKALIIIVAVIGVIVVALLGKPREDFSEEIRKTPMRVCFERVNIRKEPRTSSEIVGEIFLGEEVKLSGRTVNVFFDEMSEGLWYETTEGQWIAAKAVVDSQTFYAKFGKR